MRLQEAKKKMQLDSINAARRKSNIGIGLNNDLVRKSMTGNSPYIDGLASPLRKSQKGKPIASFTNLANQLNRRSTIRMQRGIINP
jgi:hypothetical protein